MSLNILSLCTELLSYVQNARLDLSTYWDDLYIYRGTQQGIYYDITGEVGSRELKFEFYTSAFVRPTEYFHFIMTFYENQVGVVKYKYYAVSYSGASATVGAQRKSSTYHPHLTVAGMISITDYASHFLANQFLQDSFNQPVITPGLEITIDTNAGTMTHTG